MMHVTAQAAVQTTALKQTDRPAALQQIPNAIIQTLACQALVQSTMSPVVLPVAIRASSVL